MACCLRPKFQQSLRDDCSFGRRIKQGIYDEQVVKEACRTNMVQAFNKFGPYINSYRKKISPNLWTDLENIATRWMHEDAVLPDRRPTGVLQQAQSKRNEQRVNRESHYLCVICIGGVSIRNWQSPIFAEGLSKATYACRKGNSSPLQICVKKYCIACSNRVYYCLLVFDSPVKHI